MLCAQNCSRSWIGPVGGGSLLDGEGGAQAAGLTAGGAVQRAKGVGEAAFAPGQAGGQDGAGPVVPGEPPMAAAAAAGWSAARAKAARRRGEAASDASAASRSPAPHSTAARPYGPASLSQPRSGAGSTRQASSSARTGSAATRRQPIEAASQRTRGDGCMPDVVTAADGNGSR